MNQKAYVVFSIGDLKRLLKAANADWLRKKGNPKKNNHCVVIENIEILPQPKGDAQLCCTDFSERNFV